MPGFLEAGGCGAGEESDDAAHPDRRSPAAAAPRFYAGC